MKKILIALFLVASFVSCNIIADELDMPEKKEISQNSKPTLRLKLDWTDYLSMVGYFVGPTALYALANYTAHNERLYDDQKYKIIMDGLFTGTMLSIDLIFSNITYNKELDGGVDSPKKRSRELRWILFKFIFVLRMINKHFEVAPQTLKLTTFLHEINNNNLYLNHSPSRY